MVEEHNKPSGALTDVADIERRPSFVSCPLPGAHFTQETQAMALNNKSGRLDFEQTGN